LRKKGMKDALAAKKKAETAAATARATKNNDDDVTTRATPNRERVRAMAIAVE
jgi:hypothetical protein